MKALHTAESPTPESSSLPTESPAGPRAIEATMRLATSPPAKAAAGIAEKLTLQIIATATASPAPLETPVRYGSASELRDNACNM